ncbi:hypothetical protein D3C79_1062920 [compost metagenome]
MLCGWLPPVTPAVLTTEPEFNATFGAEAIKELAVSPFISIAAAIELVATGVWIPASPELTLRIELTT